MISDTSLSSSLGSLIIFVTSRKWSEIQLPEVSQNCFLIWLPLQILKSYRTAWTLTLMRLFPQKLHFWLWYPEFLPNHTISHLLLKIFFQLNVGFIQGYSHFCLLFIKLSIQIMISKKDGWLRKSNGKIKFRSSSSEKVKLWSPLIDPFFFPLPNSTEFFGLFLLKEW